MVRTEKRTVSPRAISFQIACNIIFPAAVATCCKTRLNSLRARFDRGIGRRLYWDGSFGYYATKTSIERLLSDAQQCKKSFLPLESLSSSSSSSSSLDSSSDDDSSADKCFTDCAGTSSKSPIMIDAAAFTLQVSRRVRCNLLRVELLMASSIRKSVGVIVYVLSVAVGRNYLYMLSHALSL